MIEAITIAALIVAVGGLAIAAVWLVMMTL
jgi:hypothetical protein